MKSREYLAATEVKGPEGWPIKGQPSREPSTSGNKAGDELRHEQRWVTPEEQPNHPRYRATGSSNGEPGRARAMSLWGDASTGEPGPEPGWPTMGGL